MNDNNDIAHDLNRKQSTIYRRYRRTRYEVVPIARLSLEERRKYFREAVAAHRLRKK